MSESITKDMKYDVCSVDMKHDILNEFSDLQRLESFRNYLGTMAKELSRDMVIRYIVILYSYDSFLNKKKPPMPLDERKYIAAELAGFKKDKNEDYEEVVVSKLFQLKSDLIIKMVVEYLIFQKKPLWTEICTTEQELEEYTKLRLQPVSDEKDKDTLMAAEKKDKLRESCKRMVRDLDAYYRELFTDNLDVKNKFKSQQVSLESLARPS